MSRLPRILVIDDQFGRDPTEWVLFLRRAGLIEASQSPPSMPPVTVAEAVLCAGQTKTPQRIVNEYKVIRDAVLVGEQGGEGWSLVLLDVRFDSGTIDANGHVAGEVHDDDFGERVRRDLSAEFPGLPVVMLSSKRQVELTNQKTSYLAKQGLSPRGLEKTLLIHGRLSTAQRDRLLRLDDTVASVPATLAAFQEAFLHADSATPILLLGESGVGKGVLAQYVHRMSPRSTKPFVAVNCAAIKDTLWESEFFGHEKGAFTGAAERRRGRFEEADGGTLFLDEIGEIPAEIQTKLLGVLQNGEFERAGSSKTIKVDVRIISATNRDLQEAVKTNDFRRDLYYRINVVPIRLPPLREREEEIIPLAQSMLKRALAKFGKEGIAFSADALAVIRAASYPGNARDLGNLVDWLVSRAKGSHGLIQAEDVRLGLGRDEAASDSSAANGALVDEGRPREKAVAAFDRAPAITTRSQSSRAQPLQELLEAMAAAEINPMDPALLGIKPRLEEALQILLRRIAGALLERFQHNRQKSMQELTGDPSLAGKGPARVINELLGRKVEHPVTADDLEHLVEIWKSAGTTGKR